MTEKEHSEERRDGFSNLNQLNARLAKMDERGLVLSLAAFAEDSLGELLRAFMRQNSAADQLLDGFNSPLGTFSARIKAAHALGLITEDQCDDLEILRKIRNQFSHTWDPIAFDMQHIRDRIHNLSFSSIDDEYPETLADRIRTSISAILVELRVMIDRIETKGLRLRLSGMRLIAGLADSQDDQLSAVRASLAQLRERLSSAQGREREFLLMIRRRWVHRLEMAAASASGEHQIEFAALIGSLKLEIAAEASSV